MSKSLRQGVARLDLLKHTLEVEIGGKKIGDLTGSDVELTCLAETDDGLDWATAVCVTLAKLAERAPITSAESKPQH
jgi:hypothetical protein